MPLFNAEIAEIVRCQKKDDEYIDQLSNSICVLAQRFLNSAQYARWQKNLALVGPLAFYSATTFCELQTLGEEYVALIQTIRSSQGRISVPSTFRRISFIVLQLFGPYLFEIFLTKIRRALIAATSNVEKRTFWIQIIDSLRKGLIPTIQRLHFALFYIFGHYYHLSKRVCGVKYKSLHATTVSDDAFRLFRWLGYLSIGQILLSSIFWIYSETNGWRLKRSQKSNIDQSKSSAGSGLTASQFSSAFRCQLCLDEGKPSACTPCGHAFCWNCLLEHVTEYKNCPLCRSAVSTSRIVPLLNV